MRAAIFAGLVALACTSSGASPAAPQQADAVDVGATRSPLPDPVLRERLAELVAASGINASIYVTDPEAARLVYSLNADEPIVTASLYKLAVLLHAESLVESGQEGYATEIPITARSVTSEPSQVRPGDVVTLDRALELMITVSDNGTALELWYRYGPEALNATLAREGVANFRIGAEREANHATARAIGTFLTRLARLELVSPAASARMLARLERQTIDDRLPALLPEGVRLAHKTGNLTGLVHDAGIVFGSRGSRAVVVLTWGAETAAANDLIARIGEAVYQAIR